MDGGRPDSCGLLVSDYLLGRTDLLGQGHCGL